MTDLAVTVPGGPEAVDVSVSAPPGLVVVVEPGPVVQVGGVPGNVHTTRFPVSMFGVTGDGTNETVQLQAAFDSGLPLIVPGTVKVTVGAQLTIPSGLDLVIDGRIERDWGDGHGGAGTAMFSTGGGGGASATPVTGVRIRGTGSVGAPSHTVGGGQIFNGWFNDSLFEGIAVDTYWGGQAFLLTGHRLRLIAVKILNSPAAAGTGGIRYLGGDDFVAYGCHVECGDDALQFVPDLAGTPPTRRGAYIGCTGFSSAGRFMVCGQMREGVADISDCSFIGCHGKASGRGVLCGLFETAGGSVRRVSFRDCSIDMSNDTLATTARGAILVGVQQPAPVAGAVVADIVFDNVNVIDPVSQVLSIVRAARTIFVNSNLASSRQPFGTDVYISASPDVKFTNNTVNGGGTSATVLLTSEGTAPTVGCDRALIENNQILGVADAAFGVQIDRAVGAVVRRNQFTATGTAPGAAARVALNTTGTRVERNHFTGYPVAPVSVANGTQVYVYDNAGVAPVVTVTSPMTVDALVDRRLVELNNAAARVINLLLDTKQSLPIGEWFDAVNIGAGTWTLTPEAGVTLRGTAAILTGQAAHVVKTAANTYTTITK